MDQFEYKMVLYDTKGFGQGDMQVKQLENQFNLLGSDGWELVSCTSTNSAYGSAAPRSLVCLFKRKKS